MALDPAGQLAISTLRPTGCDHQSFPRVSPPEAVRALHHVRGFIPCRTKRTLPSPRPTLIPPEGTPGPPPRSPSPCREVTCLGWPTNIKPTPVSPLAPSAP